ncbi:6-carboxytetrahydropterin synthase QueD [Phycicoccus flavus]|uniref:6-carboxy-5,6,7,8-tetrahydropterin synthase n=1 Tax=Phycicoccus flavus TaxID=2502783 RepID=A0A8T6QZR9_9MICO|nr:6-carboxytetrahydropterin synthase QueD [Phycicoccus flavus]NHA67468.1 6-carboxytetrahydropterin synthase QueD [Phycicoccus flavus]
MRLSVVRRYSFEAAHVLSWHAGKCSRMHGHSYHLEVEVAGEPNENGVVMDFADVDEVVDPVLSELDHHLLNDLIDNPTAEMTSLHIARELSSRGLPWCRLRLWETDSGSVLLER